MKKVESIWAELSAKAPQEVEFSEEQTELSIQGEISALEDIASNLNKMASDWHQSETDAFFKVKAAATSVKLLPKTRSVKAEQAMKELASAGMKDSKVYRNLENAVEQYNDYSARSKRLQSLMNDVVSRMSSQKY
jgi:hypothetical protein